MTPARQGALEIPVRGRTETTLDLVVPFTTPALTLAALNAANRLGAGLNARIRLLKIQVVPFPLDLTQSPVPIAFLTQQLSSFESKLPVTCEVRLARESEPGLKDILGEHSLVLLATARRPWRTREERMAASLRRAGHTVVLVREGNDIDA